LPSCFIISLARARADAVTNDEGMTKEYPIALSSFEYLGFVRHSPLVLRHFFCANL
jgi:hypothetical protein